MAYVLVCMVDGLKYYIQNYRGEIVLNGLENNAILFQNEELANEELPKMKEKFDLPIFVKEVLPQTN